MLAAWIANALALAFGAGLGVRALLDPAWAARFVRLAADGQGGGQAEFRATYGGLFFALHAAALVLTLSYLAGGQHVVGLSAAGAAFVIGAGWGGAAFGRLIALWRDGADTPFNRLSVGVETLMAAATVAPWAVWALAL
ncbi:MAG: hypothetical protein JNK94_04655 [Hyphomonadaceae bacterium]|nr:hypothetical protein [Hyphomonadaceae bacterium]